MLGDSGFNGAQNRLLVNQGGGTFVDATAQLPQVDDVTSAFAAGDVDMDGDLDLLVGNGGLNRLLLNSGGGVFTDTPSMIPGHVDSTLDVALSDLDGDGDLDALLANGSGQNRLYQYSPGSGFTDSTVLLPSVVDTTAAIAVADFDADGDDDVLFGNTFENRLYRNVGGAQFADISGEIPADGDDTFSLGVADFDLDGDVDVLVGNGNAQSRLYVNRSLHLERAGVPAIGKPLTLELTGAPGATWWMALSFAVASIPLPPAGTLLIDPASLFIVGSGTVGPGGQAGVTLPVPGIGSLVGLDVWWQAGVFSAGTLRLTNREVTRISDL